MAKASGKKPNLGGKTPTRGASSFTEIAAQADLIKWEKRALVARKKLLSARYTSVETAKATTLAKSAANKKAAKSALNVLRKIEAEAASADAKVRLAKARVRAVTNAIRSEARKLAEAQKAEAALNKAVAAFIANYRKKQERVIAAKAARLARQDAARARSKVGHTARKSSEEFSSNANRSNARKQTKKKRR